MTRPLQPPRADASRLTAEECQRAMRLSRFEAVFWALMVGLGETYFLADAVHLGATPLEQGLVVSVPLFVGSLGPLLMLWLLTMVPSRRRLVTIATLAQTAALVLLAALHHRGQMTPRLLVLLASLYQMCGLGAGTVWSSWYGDLVPAAVRGRYFASRNRGVHLGTCAGLVLAGLLLQELEPVAAGAEHHPASAGRGFVLIYLLGAGLRLVSTLLLWRSPEPRFRGLSDRREIFQFVRTERGGQAWRMLGMGALLQMLVYVGAPYFQPFMLETLKLSYVQFMVSGFVEVFSKFAFLSAWGRVLDRHRARPIYGYAVLLVAIVPLPWLWTYGMGWVLIGRALSGICWAGYEVAFFALLLEFSYKRTRPGVFAAQSVLQGLGQVAGSLMGAGVVFLASGDYRYAFMATLLGRLLVAAVFPRLVPRVSLSRPPGSRGLLLRVIGYRPFGGLVHRPLDAGPSLRGRKEPPPEE